MTARMKVVHITAHLGGGVGRVLSGIANFRKTQNVPIHETFICLEHPENKQFVNILRRNGVEIAIQPDRQATDRLVSSADIVQIEWWHHPLLAGWLCKQENFTARLIVWSHISGLHYPAIPQSFLSLPHIFLFSTPVSKAIPQLAVKIQAMDPKKTSVVHSSGGFDNFPVVHRDFFPRQLRYGYIGTYNFAKLHPDILQFVRAVKDPRFTVDFYGDKHSNPKLITLVHETGLEKKISLHGYTQNPGEILKNLDVFVYILNPLHYGTTENALLEAMASGVIPIVMNNPIESSIVQNERTGIIVDSPKSFAEAITSLNNDIQKRRELSVNCSREIRRSFALSKTERDLREHYYSILDDQKRHFQFQDVFGRTPHEWFLSCLGGVEDLFLSTDHVDEIRLKRLAHHFLYEKSKSSAYHFFRYYPDSSVLREWTETLDQDKAYSP